MFAVMRFPDTIKASSGYKICMNLNVHKGILQAANDTIKQHGGF